MKPRGDYTYLFIHVHIAKGPSFEDLHVSDNAME